MKKKMLILNFITLLVIFTSTALKSMASIPSIPGPVVMLLFGTVLIGLASIRPGKIKK
jgi:hypothetical protein